MMLSSLTYLGFVITAVLDEVPDFDVSFSQVHEAAEREALITFLAKQLGDKADLSLLIGRPAELKQVEAALMRASSALEGREARKTGVASSGLCLVLALVFEALQQNFGSGSGSPK